LKEKIIGAVYAKYLTLPGRVSEELASTKYFDADELLASREVERNIVRHPNGAALDLSIRNWMYKASAPLS
jgi:hypothetical protein